MIFLEYAVDVADACRARGIRAVAVTAGYVGEQPRGTNVILCQERSFTGEPPRESVCGE